MISFAPTLFTRTTYGNYASASAVCKANNPTAEPTSIAELQDGTKIVYELAAASSHGTKGAPAVFLHDFMTDHHLFDPQFVGKGPTSTLNGRTCLRYDMRGFGQTSGDIDIGGGYSHVEDLMEVLEKVGLGGEEAVHVVACGMGGSIALDAAWKYPDRVLSVACVCSGLEGHRWGRNHFMQTGNELFETIDDWKKEWMQWNKVWAVVTRDPESKVAKSLLKMAEVYKGQHFLKPSNFNRVDYLPTFHRLGDIRAPVMTVDGVNDTPQFRKINVEIHHKVQNPVLSEAQVLANASHWITLEQPAKLKVLLEGLWEVAEKTFVDRAQNSKTAVTEIAIRL